MILADLLTRTGLDVLDHLERALAVPIVDGFQAQGDLLIAPSGAVPEVVAQRWATWAVIPSAGVELVRGVAGNNPHTLVADAVSGHYTLGLSDPEALAIALVENSSPVYLIHPEHGATGLAPGRWVIRRQREYSTTTVLTRARGGRSFRLVAD